MIFFYLRHSTKASAMGRKNDICCWGMPFAAVSGWQSDAVTYLRQALIHYCFNRRLSLKISVVKKERCFSAKAWKFIVTDVTFEGLIGGFRTHWPRIWTQKYLQCTIEGLHVDFLKILIIFSYRRFSGVLCEPRWNEGDRIAWNSLRSPGTFFHEESSFSFWDHIKTVWRKLKRMSQFSGKLTSSLDTHNMKSVSVPV